jgi:hypothetical protein
MESEGKKFDQEKVKMHLLPFVVLRDVAKVLTFGAKKYDEDNWKKVQDAEKRYFAAALRHLTEFQEDKNTLDEETKMPHLANAITDLIFLYWHCYFKKGENNGKS